MKKTLSIFLAIMMVISLAGCSAKRITRDEDGNIIEAQPKKKLYVEMNFEEKLEYMSTRERKSSSIKTDCGMVAPACYKGAPEYGYINNLGDWFIAPLYKAAYSFKDGLAPVLDQYADYEYINSAGELVALNLQKKETIKAAKHFNEGYVALVVDNGLEQNKLYASSDGVNKITATN
ncbi:MAG: WG repeat-containing protein, partial [Bacillota bacterium]|nr:WG repeat-containing protein [Bacillota bacterium]